MSLPLDIADVERRTRAELRELLREEEYLEVRLEDTRALTTDEEHDFEDRQEIVEAKIQRRERLLALLGRLARQHAQAEAITIEIEALIRGAAEGDRT